MHRSFVLPALAISCLLPNPAQAQTEKSDCQLHVWPATSLGSVYSGWFHGGIVNGAVDGREGFPNVPPDPMGTPVQVELLDQAQPQTLLQPAGYRIVLHPDALTSREIRGTPGRIAPESTACYAELIVDDVVLRQDFVTGDYLTMLFRFRDFGSGPSPVRSFGTWVKTRLIHFPPKSAEDNAAALLELRTAYKQNITLFFAALQPKPKR